MLASKMSGAIDFIITWMLVIPVIAVVIMAASVIINYKIIKHYQINRPVIDAILTGILLPIIGCMFMYFISRRES